MLSFSQYLDEDKVNYNHMQQNWQVRSDTDDHMFKYDQDQVVMKDAKPFVDHAAHASGKRVYAYLKGEVMHKAPDLSNHTAHPIKFKPNDTKEPFVHTDDDSAVKNADYVVFHKNKVTAYYK